MGSAGRDPSLVCDLRLRYLCGFSRSMHFAIQFLFVFFPSRSAASSVLLVSGGLCGVRSTSRIYPLCYLSRLCVTLNASLSPSFVHSLSKPVCLLSSRSSRFPCPLRHFSRLPTHVNGKVNTQHTAIAAILNRTQLPRCRTNASSSLSASLALRATPNLQCHSPFKLCLSFFSACLSLPPFLQLCFLRSLRRFSAPPSRLGAQSPRSTPPSPLFEIQPSFSTSSHLSTLLVLRAARHIQRQSPSRRCSPSPSARLCLSPLHLLCTRAFHAASYVRHSR